MRVVLEPQRESSPNVRGNSPQAYDPGDAYVDVVGDDLYNNPAFIEQMAAWVHRHRRVELLAWFESRPGSKFDIASMPRSLAAYRRLIVPLGR